MNIEKIERRTEKKTKGAGHYYIMACLLIFLFSFFIPISSYGLDFLLRPKGLFSAPLGSGNFTNEKTGEMTRYKPGGGGELGFEIDFSTIWPNAAGLGYTLGIEASMQVNNLDDKKPKNESESVSYYTFGGVAGLYFFPTSRFFTRIDGAIGVQASANSQGRSGAGLFWRGGGELGFRITPGITLAANVGWRQFSENGNKRNSGIYTGLTAQFTFKGGGVNREAVGSNLEQYGELYPVFMQLYQSNPIGSVVLRNNENAEIRDVRLFFRADTYSASEFPCGSVSIIPRGRTADLPLFADFSPEVLRFTDSGKIIGELVIRYSFLGQERETVRAVTIATHNRNTVIEGNPSALAAFISPTSPETLDFARFIAGLSRANSRIGHNQNMQYAIWLLEGLRASNIRRGTNMQQAAPSQRDNDRAFLGENFIIDNEAQYPAETLSYRSGSSRDLALLFAAALEGVGIPSAFIQVEGEGNVEGEFLVAVNLGVNQAAAETLFNGTDKILIVNGEVWLPLSMSAFNDGFSACWRQGVDMLKKVFSGELDGEFVIVEEAWASYPPAPLPELGKSLLQTDNEAALREVNRVINAYIAQEINPLVNSQRGNNTAAGQNRLGILLVRAGQMAEGKAAYERAAGMGSVPAMTNRGNLSLAENDLTTAERWFRQALQRDPENFTAQRGMERVQGAR